LTLKLPDFSRRQFDIEPRLKPIDRYFAPDIKWKSSVAVRPERLHCLQLADAANSSDESHRETQV
jgi:hypothetical protein